MNDNTVIVDLEKYEALIRENEDLKHRNGELISRSVGILDRINDLEQFVMKTNYNRWGDYKEPEDCFVNYNKMLDLDITRRTMKAFIEEKIAKSQKENENE